MSTQKPTCGYSQQLDAHGCKPETTQGLPTGALACPGHGNDKALRQNTAPARGRETRRGRAGVGDCSDAGRSERAGVRAPGRRPASRPGPGGGCRCSRMRLGPSPHESTHERGVSRTLKASGFHSIDDTSTKLLIRRGRKASALPRPLSPGRLLAAGARAGHPDASAGGQPVPASPPRLACR